ncbi:MAG: Fibronectin type-III protein [Bacteroidetes bacterium]|nr:Fibronectin type-III protein [Bacteroidota bacterium]
MTGRKHVVNAIVLFSFVFGTTWLGCKSDETTAPTPGPTIVAPTNLRAFSVGPTSVGLIWSLSTSEAEASFNNYVVRAKDPSGTISGTINVPKGTPNVTFTPLLEGIIYTFVIRSSGTGGTVSSDSASVRWSPARRFLTDSTNGPPIQVYELRSTLGASGLQFSSSSGAYARVRSLGTGNPDRFLCDIYIDSVGGGAICLKNIALLGYPRNTFFSTDVRDALDLNDPQSAPPDTTSYQLNRINLPTTTVTQAKVLYARTSDNHYVRILVQKNLSTNLLYSGSGSDRYVVLQLSYQNTAGNWFAKPGRAPRIAGQ